MGTSFACIFLLIAHKTMVRADLEDQLFERPIGNKINSKNDAEKSMKYSMADMESRKLS